MGSFSIPLSGLNAAQEQLQSVSNNLANINTDGYKDQNLSFSDLFAQTGSVNGAGNPVQTGLGVMEAGTNSNFTQGNLNPTGSASNMALSGNGFFVTQSAGGGNNYTRAGDFTTNSAGFLTTPSGQLLLGYPAVNGVVNSSGPLQPMQVGVGVTSPAVASTTMQITANLSSTTAIGGSGASSSPTIYDSLGSQHVLNVSYTKTAANTWTYSVTIPSSDLAAGGTGTTVVGSGTLNFNSAGALTSTTGVVPISLPTLADGASAPLAIAGPFGTGAAPSITQTAAASDTSAMTQDGSASGTLQSFAVQPDGTIQGTFNNGTGATITLGQVAVANFGNVQGLTQVGGNDYQVSASSGAAVIGVAGTGGRGTVVGGSVEQSNVDIATEFAKLIVAQQAYSANAKSVTTFNQVSQATLAMLQ